MSTPGLTYLIDAETSTAHAFDVVLNEDYQSESEVTEFPVEEGIDVTDHVRRKPDGIVLDVAQSNTPIMSQLGTYKGEVTHLRNLPPGVTIANSDLQDAYRAQRFYATLKGMKDGAVPCRVHTNLLTDILLYFVPKTSRFRYVERTWVIKAIKNERGPKTGDIVRMSVHLKELRIVASLRGDALAAAPTTEDHGTHEATNEASKVPQEYSVADGLLHRNMLKDVNPDGSPVQ